MELRNQERTLALGSLEPGGSREEGVDSHAAMDTCESIYEQIFGESMP